MSFRAQIAFGKNLTLQKQLEVKFADFKRNFKNSRRRLDALEEECVSSLYKLLLDAKRKQNDNKEDNGDDSERTRTVEAKRPHSVYEVSEEENEGLKQKRPHTSMSAKTYVQSYSFKRDGMNIAKNRRDRFINSRKEKKEEAMVQIERRQRPGSSGEPDVDFDKKNEYLEVTPPNALPVRPATTEPTPSEKPLKGLLKRPQTRNTLSVSDKRSVTPSLSTTEEIQQPGNRIVFNKTSVAGGLPDGTKTTPREVTSVIGHRAETPFLSTVHEASSANGEGDTPLIHVKINAKVIDPSRFDDTDKSRLNSRNDFEEELLPISEDDKNCLDTIMDDTRNGLSRNQKYDETPLPLSPFQIPDDGVLEKSTEKTQSFLTQYAKKSKLFGYVLKTRTSVVAPRDSSRKIYRSPCITYQELASLKAGIKQQEPRTRLLLQKSAKLSKYVGNLVDASKRRSLQQAIK